jgi:hypothetical protein
MEVNEKQHGLSIFRALLPYYGKIVTPNFLKKTAEYIPGIVRIPKKFKQNSKCQDSRFDPSLPNDKSAK